jgi:hypothetical protein
MHAHGLKKAWFVVGVPRDLPLLVLPQEAMSRFEGLPRGPDGGISKPDLEAYVNSTFGQAGR